MPRATQCTEYRGVKKTQSLYRIDHTLLILFTRLYFTGLYTLYHTFAVRDMCPAPPPRPSDQRPRTMQLDADRALHATVTCESVLGLRTPPATTLQPPKVSRVSYAVYGVRLFIKHMATYTCVCHRTGPYLPLHQHSPRAADRSGDVRCA
jgi:hypothetical protein